MKFTKDTHPNLASYRKTKFEIHEIHLGMDFKVTVSDRNADFEVSPNGRSRAVKLPDFIISDNQVTDEEREAIHAGLAALETAVERIAQQMIDDATPEHFTSLVSRSHAAQIETARLEAEAIVKRAEHEEFVKNMEDMKMAAKEHHLAEMEKLRLKHEEEKAKLSGEINRMGMTR